MSNRIPAIAGIAVVAALFSACDPAEDRSEEAGFLRDALGALPGVEDATLHYDEPEVLDPADVNLEVVMNEEASPAEVAAVFSTAYEGLTDAHADEEGNLTVRYTGDELDLRTFESEADAADVEEAAYAGAEVAAVHERVYIQVMTQEVANDRHVESLALVHLPAGTAKRARHRVRDEIAATYGDLPVRVDVRVKRR